MKTKMFLTVLAVAGLSGVSGSVLAQNTSTAPAPLVISGTSVSSAPTPPAAQPLPYAVAEVLRLHRAQLGDDTIIAYIRNSGLGFALNADLIIYLQQQGISSAVLNVMLSQPLPGGTAGTASTYVPLPTTAPPAVDDSDANYTPYYTPYYDYDYDYPYYTDYGYYYPGPYVVGGGWYGGGYYGGRGGHGGWNGGSGGHPGGTGGSGGWHWGGSVHAGGAAVVHGGGGGGFRGGGGGGFHGGGGGGGGGGGHR